MVCALFRSFIVAIFIMVRLQLYIVFLLGFCASYAYHIVGGEIEFIYVGDGQYRVNLIQYFDRAQINNPEPDPFITIYIFRNADNQLMSRHQLNLAIDEEVAYTNIACVIDELRTSRILYSADIALTPEFYASETGYYLQWERCCRNEAIDNIENASGTGMNYVLEIPPLMKNGAIFKNSSPQLFKPLSDYACIDQLYYADFSGVDPDGDSLVYSLTNPLNSSSQVEVPTPQPKPHFSVGFKAGYSMDNMIPATRPLAISPDGLLTVNPSEAGLFVFAVKIEEFRNGLKIGEVRREFQLLVVDGCEPPDPPEVAIEVPGNPTFNPATDVLTYTVADAKCFNFLVSNVTQGETISLRAEGVNFAEDLNDIFTINQIPVGSENQISIEVCVPECPPLRDSPFVLDLIAADDACPLPQLDTLRLTLQVQPPPNNKPIPSFTDLTVIQQEDNDPIYRQVITATDDDNEEMEFTLLVEGIEDPMKYGFDLNLITTLPGQIEGELTWDTDCILYDFSEIQQFDVKLLVNDMNFCKVPGDTININALVVLPPNTDPQITIQGSLPSTIEVGNELDFQVTASDSDGDEVTLKFVGGNFNPEAYGIDFSDANGSGSISRPFNWNLACDASTYADGQQFELIFIADDNDKCKTKNFDTLRHTLTVNYPMNESPQFNAISRIQSARVNELIEIQLEAYDADSDEIAIDFASGFRKPASSSLNLVSEPGTGNASAILTWQPECTLLRFGDTRSLQDVVLQVSDNACPIPNVDTLKITFEIFDDAERQRNFLPPNVFTPNNDGKNDHFKLFGNQDINQNLPPDNCDNVFEYINISNRAGVQVFRSRSRDFSWSGDQWPAGIYYYVIKFSSTEFKGYVHLIR